MITSWNEEMATGFDEIDSQHKDLLRKVDDLLRASKALRGHEEIARLIWFLKRYVRKHFRDEERLQLTSGYPGYQLHKAQHDHFYREVNRLEARFAKEGPNTNLIVQAIQMMCAWLHDHFHRVDMELVAYLREVNKSEHQ
jgi:hemerythrin